MTQNINAERSAALLAEAVSSVFADMAFIDVANTGKTVTVPEAPETPLPEGVRVVAIDVLAPLSCRIELRLNQSLQDKIVENLFGEELQSVERNSAEDTILEMLNIIAGSFLSAYFGSGSDILLELPRYLYFTEQTAGETVANVLMDAEGEELSVALTSVRYRY